MKSNKGITLVALVITIIVLLILAGVSISLVVGDNGVLNQSQKAAKNTDLASATSAMQLTLTSLNTKFMGDNWTEDVTAKLYAKVKVSDLDTELQKNGFYIVKYGSYATYAAASGENVAASSGTDNAGTPVTVVISEGEAKTDADHGNTNKNTTYTFTVTWKDTSVSLTAPTAADTTSVNY